MKTLNYPALQESFIHNYFNQDRKSFTKILLNNLVDDKFSRKDRFRFPNKPSFFETKTPIEDLDVIEQVLDELFSLDQNDEYFVEKSYYFLDEIISFAKGEGSREIVNYLDSNPEIREEAEKHGNGSYLSATGGWMRTTHQNADTAGYGFNERLDHIKEYCQKYRSDCYKIYYDYKLSKD